MKFPRFFVALYAVAVAMQFFLKDDPTFPRPVPLSDSKSRGAPVGWILAEAQAWVRQRIALRKVAA